MNYDDCFLKFPCFSNLCIYGRRVSDTSNNYDYGMHTAKHSHTNGITVSTLASEPLDKPLDIRWTFYSFETHNLTAFERCVNTIGRFGAAIQGLNFKHL